MSSRNVLVLGGSGYVGSAIVARLAAEGRRVLVPTRRRDHAKHLIVLPTVDVVEANLQDDAALDRLVAKQDAVINLVGILQGSWADFERAHATLPARVVAACRRAKVRRLVHMSALGADADGPSMYQRSKGMGEAAVMASKLDWTILQPSVIFGPGDRFLNLFARLAKFAPVLPVGGADVRFQPVFLEDVAAATVNALDNPATIGRRYELAGPAVYTLRQLVELAARFGGHPRRVLALPEGVARLQARFMELLPGEPLLSRDNLDSMKRDNVASVQPFVPAPELGISLTPLEPEAAVYLAGMHPRTRFDAFRTRARR